MNVNQLLYPLRRWWWLVILTTLVAGVTSYLIVRDLPPIYETSTTLMVGRTIDNPNPNNNDFWLGQQLATTYASVSLRDPVRDGAMAALGLDELPEYRAQAVPNSQFLEITVVDTSPERARRVANELARQLILQSPAGSQEASPERAAFVDGQLNDLEANIALTTQEIADLQENLGTLVSAVQIADAQNKLGALEDKLETLQTNYAALLTSSEGGAVNTLTVIEDAAQPYEPVGPNKPGIILLSSAIGFILAAGAAHILEHLDNTLRTPEDIERTLNLPVLGYIADMGKDKEPWTYVARHPRAPIAEAFRSLRTNLEFAAVDFPLKTVFIASPDAAEGKTTISTNLALIWAQSERKVTLMDADLRQPKLHELTGQPLQPGLAEVFQGRAKLQDVLHIWKERRVSVLTAGGDYAGLNEVFASEKLLPIMSELDESSDIILIDGPPIYITDAMILAARADGVILVVQQGRTRGDVAKSMLDLIQRAGARVVGVVLNRISPRNAVAFGGYRFYSPRYVSDPYFDDGNSRKSKTGRGDELKLAEDQLSNPSDSRL